MDWSLLLYDDKRNSRGVGTALSRAVAFCELTNDDTEALETFLMTSPKPRVGSTPRLLGVGSFDDVTTTLRGDEPPAPIFYW